MSIKNDQNSITVPNKRFPYYRHEILSSFVTDITWYAMTAIPGFAGSTLTVCVCPVEYREKGTYVTYHV